MKFKKLSLKKSRVMELSSELNSLPLEQTDQVAGGNWTMNRCRDTIDAFGTETEGCTGGRMTETCFENQI